MVQVTLSVSSNELRSDGRHLARGRAIGALVPAWRAVRIRLIGRRVEMRTASVTGTSRTLSTKRWWKEWRPNLSHTSPPFTTIENDGEIEEGP